MPCPYFEPQTPFESGFSRRRLPLIDEYAGLCRAHAEGPVLAPPETVSGPCNQGYAGGLCKEYPADAKTSAMRYSVVRESETALELLCIEEAAYAPVSWHTVEYSIASGLLEPELSEECIRAQAVAFCRSFLKQQRSEAV